MSFEHLAELVRAIGEGDMETIQALDLAAREEARRTQQGCQCDDGLVFYSDKQGRSRVGGCIGRCKPGEVPFGAPLCDPQTGAVIERGYSKPKGEKRK